MRTSIFAAVVCLAVLFPVFASGSATDPMARLDALEADLARQGELIRQQQQLIDALRQELEAAKVPVAVAPAAPEPQPAGGSGFFGASSLTNPNISLMLDTHAYASNRSNDQLEEWGIPGFTSNGLESRQGFNLRTAELTLFAPVDPYFNLYANLPVTEEGMELEEAYVVTTALPEGFQLKGGKFKSNFTRVNAQHPHAWDFFDIPLPYRAFLGDEGMGGEKGVQVTWLPEFPVYTQFGAEVLQGENDLLFGADAQGSPHAFTLFVKCSVDLSDASTLYFGPSVVFGKTLSENIVADREFSGNSALYGMEAVWKWKPAPRRALTVQGEYLLLDQHGDLADIETGLEDSLRRRQDGFYVQGIYRWDRWGVGARYDVLEIFADRYQEDGDQHNLGDTPWRATAAIEFNPSEFTRIRLQYNHDESSRDGRSNEEAILQFLFGIGAHAAHAF